MVASLNPQDLVVRFMNPLAFNVICTFTRTENLIHFGIFLQHFKITLSIWESMAGLVIKSNEMVEFKDDLGIGNQLKARNVLQRVCTIPGVLPLAVCSPDSSKSRLNSNPLKSV